MYTYSSITIRWCIQNIENRQTVRQGVAYGKGYLLILCIPYFWMWPCQEDRTNWLAGNPWMNCRFQKNNAARHSACYDHVALVAKKQVYSGVIQQSWDVASRMFPSCWWLPFFRGQDCTGCQFTPLMKLVVGVVGLVWTYACVVWVVFGTSPLFVVVSCCIIS